MWESPRESRRRKASRAVGLEARIEEAWARSSSFGAVRNRPIRLTNPADRLSAPTTTTWATVVASVVLAVVAGGTRGVGFSSAQEPTAAACRAHGGLPD